MNKIEKENLKHIKRYMRMTGVNFKKAKKAISELNQEMSCIKCDNILKKTMKINLNNDYKIQLLLK